MDVQDAVAVELAEAQQEIGVDRLGHRQAGGDAGLGQGGADPTACQDRAALRAQPIIRFQPVERQQRKTAHQRSTLALIGADGHQAVTQLAQLVGAHGARKFDHVAHPRSPASKASRVRQASLVQRPEGEGVQAALKHHRAFLAFAQFARLPGLLVDFHG